VIGLEGKGIAIRGGSRKQKRGSISLEEEQTDPSIHWVWQWEKKDKMPQGENKNLWISDKGCLRSKEGGGKEKVGTQSALHSGKKSVITTAGGKGGGELCGLKILLSSDKRGPKKRRRSVIL